VPARPAPRLLALLVALSSALLAAPATGQAAIGDCTPGATWAASRPDLASRVVDLVNQHRTCIGLVALNVSPTLTASAVWKARHMATYNYLAHDDPAPPVARTVPDRLEACGYPSRSTGWGENIAYGYSTPESVMQGWLNSPGHRANIEQPAFRAIGVGAAANASGVLYWAQDFGQYDDSATVPPAGPTVTLTSAPASSTKTGKARFAWTTTGTVTSTTCQIDAKPAKPCASPKGYSRLALGTHTFTVTVASSSGSASASYTWTRTA
jgi:uncharacterized protein YkwD